MGLFDFISRRRKAGKQPPVSATPEEAKKIAIVANSGKEQESFQTFDNSNITFSGSLSGYDYDSILRDKQSNINSLYQLADYYVDKDPIVRGIVKHVYVPYAACSQWYLTCPNEKTIELFEEQYAKMRLKEKLEDIMYQYFKYGNVFVYIWDGNIITLPVHKCKIGNVALNGTPTVDYDVMSITNELRPKTYSVEEKEIKGSRLETILKGYPEEVGKAIKAGQQYAQLNPANTFVLQGAKEGWQRYSVPFIASCLSSLAKKELISSWEDSVLNLGIRSFVHVKYGIDSMSLDMLPDISSLNAIQRNFTKAMSGFPIAVTNHMAKAEVIQPDMSDLFQFDKYAQVNNDILSAGGIAGIIINGKSEDGSTFASAQVSMQAAAARIESARREFCDLMFKVNQRLIEDIKLVHTNNLKDVPEFHFAPLDMSGEKALRETCQSLWERGLVSTKTMMDTQGYSLAKEKMQREVEASDGTDKILAPRDSEKTGPATEAQSAEEEVSTKKGKVGRPKTDDNERTSDPDAAERGKQPKPSNPEGSKGDEGIS